MSIAPMTADIVLLRGCQDVYILVLAAHTNSATTLDLSQPLERAWTGRIILWVYGGATRRHHVWQRRRRRRLLFSAPLSTELPQISA